MTDLPIHLAAVRLIRYRLAMGRISPYLSLIVLILLLAPTGCFSISVRKNVQGLAAVEHRQHLFLFGSIGDPVVPLPKICPQGVAHFEELFTPADILYHFITVGVYSPRTVRIECEAR